MERVRAFPSKPTCGRGHLGKTLWSVFLLVVALLAESRGKKMDTDEYERGLHKLVLDFLGEESHNGTTNHVGDQATFPHNVTPSVIDASGDHNLFPTFPCFRMEPSSPKPESVHRLRPADINVVAAMGDSLTAGKAAGTRGVTAVLFDYRGLSWSIGGDGTFNTLHSLPNIIREYNPDLYGFSNSIGDSMSKPSRLNVAKSGATSNDLAFQAALLIERLKNDQFVNYANDWKVITILIGANDLCRSCKAIYNPKRYVHRLKSALDLLHDAVPRAFVNLVEVMPIELARRLPRGAFCRRIETYYCQCAVEPRSEAQYERLITDRREYQRLTEELVASGRYEDREDFTVVLQSLYKNYSLPLVPGTQDIDYRPFAVDCFHLSLRGQSQAGLGLWNNMLQPVGRKSTDLNITDSILCPTESHPFLATAKNSPMLLKTPGPIRHYKNRIVKQWRRRHHGPNANIVPMKKKNPASYNYNYNNDINNNYKNNNNINNNDNDNNSDNNNNKINNHKPTGPDGDGLVVNPKRYDHYYHHDKDGPPENGITDMDRSDDVTLYPPTTPLTNVSDDVMVLIRREPDTWQLWYMVLGWTMLMSTLLAFCVSVRNMHKCTVPFTGFVNTRMKNGKC